MSGHGASYSSVIANDWQSNETIHEVHWGVSYSDTFLFGFLLIIYSPKGGRKQKIISRVAVSKSVNAHTNTRMNGY